MNSFFVAITKSTTLHLLLGAALLFSVQFSHKPEKKPEQGKQSSWWRHERRRTVLRGHPTTLGQLEQISTSADTRPMT